jgi:hypothetical protein
MPISTPDSELTAARVNSLVYLQTAIERLCQEALQYDLTHAQGRTPFAYGNWLIRMEVEDIPGGEERQLQCWDRRLTRALASKGMPHPWWSVYDHASQLDLADKGDLIAAVTYYIDLQAQAHVEGSL